jgi:hypothetical protein
MDNSSPYRNNYNKTHYNKKIFSSGIVSRPIDPNVLRCTFLNLSNTNQFLNLTLNDWTNNSAVNVQSDNIYLTPYEGKVINIVLKSPLVSENTSADKQNLQINSIPNSVLLRLNSYSDVINIELYEVRIIFSNYINQAVKINLTNLLVLE